MHITHLLELFSHELLILSIRSLTYPRTTRLDCLPEKKTHRFEKHVLTGRTMFYEHFFDFDNNFIN